LSAAVCLALALLTALVFRNVGEFAFVFDDEAFIPLNEHVLGGLSLEGLRWAFTTGFTANWHPVTWLSHMLDVQLFGLNAGAHHLVNLLFHEIAVVLLFLVLRRLTGALWPSAFVAALFAVHPSHVESVAWVAERKDVLSALFWILALGAYGRYAARPGRGRYALVAVLFALGLMSKPMVVTFPRVLLLLDWWPLGRLRFRPGSAATLGRLALEKIPLALLAGATAVVTFLTQQSSGAVASSAVYRPAGRVAHAMISYAAYLGTTVWPVRLAFFYPYQPGAVPTGEALGACAVLAAITAAAIGLRARTPSLLAGWLWYLVTLLPVIGLVQVGGQAMADRYLYLPLIGLGLAAAWGAEGIARHRRSPGVAIALAAVCALLALAVTASRQAEHWRTPESLFRHALDVTEENWVAHEGYAVELNKQGRQAEALEHYREAARINPSVLLRTKLERAIADLGLSWQVQQYRDQLAARQGTAPEYYRLGNGLALVGRFPEALEAFQKAARLDPGNVEILNDLGSSLAMLGRWREAEAAYREALRLRPGFPAARRNLERALEQQRKP
jgi:tetratricopeptide (TPR) repeat protein